MKHSEAEKAEAMEVAALMERLDEWGLDERIQGSEISSRRTSDGFVFVIKIDPWTVELAEQITGVAELTWVAVEPLTDSNGVLRVRDLDVLCFAPHHEQVVSAGVGLRLAHE